MNKNTRKAINFDLSTKLLKQHYPSKTIWGYRKAYKDIEKYLISKGFEHNQWSGYVSKQPMDKYTATKIVAEMSVKFQWLGKCVSNIQLTNYDANSDITKITANPDRFLQQTKRKTVTKEKIGLKERLSQAKKTADKYNAESLLDKERTPHKKGDISI